jgi:tetratricopeptide (TPR) repeat protein
MFEAIMRRMPLALFALTVVPSLFAADPPKLDQARQYWRTGKYAEALEAYDAIAKQPEADNPASRVKIALGRAECLVSTGEIEKAVDALRSFAEGAKPDPDAAARLAEIEFGRGRWDQADAHVTTALAGNPDHLLGRWMKARLHEAKGEVKEANELWKWFIERYNVRKREIERDADALLIVGQAAEKYAWANARGEDLADSLNDVINDIYEGALRAEPRCWQAAWLQGRLFLAGYREADAFRELNRALLINPSAAEVITTLGQADLQGYKLADGRKKVEDALEINPHYGPAHILLADLNISDERFADALAAAKKAVAENPKDLEALGRLAASYRLLVEPLGAAAAEAVAQSVTPKPAAFYAALGERLADRRKYHSAERALLLAIAADPEQAAPRIGLGMLYMQIGREEEANDLFKAAFDADPFNVRAKNMLKVLEHMAAYTPIDSAHFRVLVLAKQDAMLGKYMSRFLESIYGEFTSRLGFRPPGLTKIEIMQDHKWFSGRTTGQSFIPTVGACTGKVVALASPRSTRQPFNWSRVLAHEVTHVITLQQTEFNIPHWYTEALAVESEGTPRPQPWNKMLLERVPTRKKLLNLDTINLGFIRPNEPEDRQLAYCQSQLYAQYMLKRFGQDALIKMLAAYRRGLTTDRAITACFGVDKANFEEEYLKFLDDVVKTIRTRVDDEEKVTFSQRQRQLTSKPDDADLNARMAYEHFARRDYREARPFADKALKLKPHHPLASYVKARLLQSIGDSDAALAILEPALDPNAPNERVIDLLAELQMKDGKLDEAERLYEMARKDDPYHSKWIAGLARVHLRYKEKATTPEERRKWDEKLVADLAMLAANDSDDLAVRKTLAEYTLKMDLPEQAAKWATECLYIDVYDPSHHTLLGDALVAEKKYAGAIEEYQAALELKPKKPNDIKVLLAKAQFGDGKADEAKATLDAILKADPDHPAAKALQEEISKGK